MKLPIPSRALLQSAVVIGLACRVASGAELPRADGSGSRKVEFTEVKELPCLQPVVKSADAELKDFRAAEQRWLSDHFPGHRAPRWQDLLVLLPDVKTSSQSTRATMQSETAYVQLGDGSEIKVCFDIGLSSAKKDQRE